MKKKILITGGAGFIGINAAAHFLRKKCEVTIYDNFFRKGSKENVQWLRSSKSRKPNIVLGDISRPSKDLTEAVKNADIILHMAAQVAVTTSIKDPLFDFNTNLLGTINLLEIMRREKSKAILIYGSTNKVYGSLSYLPIKENKLRYQFAREKQGVSENMPLDFYTPYACSKGSADQYVRDYARIYGLKNIVFRQSCIFGPHQFGIEDQGWVAWLLISAMLKKRVTIYGNGKQVRDLLYIDDLLEAIDRACESIRTTSGEIYNIGGGIKNTISVWSEFGPMIEEILGEKINATYLPWRQGDQKIFYADIAKAKKDFGWTPKTTVSSGIRMLFQWLKENKNGFTHFFDENNAGLYSAQ
ncbi:MAG: GDP-mannose 4,6-dehydratase [bacterium]|nr:GDP-mannose 4,6-dehydratase [bacterium]